MGYTLSAAVALNQAYTVGTVDAICSPRIILAAHQHIFISVENSLACCS